MNPGAWSHIRAVWRREFAASTGSTAAWIFLAIFLVLIGTFTFVISDLLSLGQADLTLFFNWMPWVFMLIIPALGMPLWSEERRTGTFELSLSFPVSIWELVLGKYLAGMSLVGIALLLTAGIPLTVGFLGEPDAGAILCGYAGAFLAGSVFLSVACFCSALTKSQTASFLLSVFICAILMFFGWDRVIGILYFYLPAWCCQVLSYCAILPHYQAFQRGLIDSSELVYCLAMTVLFLSFARAALLYSASGNAGIFTAGTLSDRYTLRQVRGLAIRLIGGMYLFFCVTYGANTFAFRLDCTRDRAYSLSQQARKIASETEKPVVIRLYLSPESANLPGELRQYAERVRWLLREFAKDSNGKVRFQVIRPEQDSTDEEAALAEGIKPAQNQTGERYFLGLAVSSAQNNAAIPFLSPQREMLFEYEVVRAIQNVIRTERPKIGVISSLAVLGKAGGQNTVPAPAWHLFQELSRDFDLIELAPDAPEIQDDLSALFVVHPSGISRRGEFAIDQFLLKGGRVAVFVDPKNAYALANIRRDTTLLEKTASNLPHLFQAWGIDFEPTLLAADMNFKYDIIGQNGVKQSIPTALCVTKEGINPDESATASMTSLRMNFSGFFLFPKDDKNLEFTELVYTTPRSLPVSKDDISDRTVAAFSANPNPGNRLPVIARLRGTFRTAFPDGLPDRATGLESEQDSTPLRESLKPSEVFLFGDADMLFHDACVVISQDEFGQQIILPRNDNIALIQNVADQLCGGVRLSELRCRVPMNRPLSVINRSKVKAEMEFTERTMKAVEEFQKEERQVAQIQKMLIANPAGVSLSDEQKALISNFARRKAEFNREMKRIRHQLRTELERINNRVRFINIGILPLLVILFGILWQIARNFRFRKRKDASA